MSNRDGRVLVIRERYTNETEGYTFGDVDWYEPFHDDPDNHKYLFRSLQREYGRCTSKVYEDLDSTWNMGEKRTVVRGWYFEKRMKYEDSDEMYTQGVWVEYAVVTCAKCLAESVYRHEHSWKRLQDAEAA